MRIMSHPIRAFRRFRYLTPPLCVSSDFRTRTLRRALVLDDGTGRIHPSLIPLHDLLVHMERPKSRLIWLRILQVPALIRDLASGHVPLNHDAVQDRPNWRTAACLRDLLMDSGVLPRIDR
ncbi:hypothetical protein [Streptomyces sp. NPDC006784]|uniref:hypothetical protein n=1 Tax=Streptomyces sp. NPDC006784 TaxID=3364764 RepID=UPI0036C1D155